MVHFANSYFVFITNPIYTVVDPSDKLLAPRVQYWGSLFGVTKLQGSNQCGGGYLILFYNNEVWAIEKTFFQELAESD